MIVTLSASAERDVEEALIWTEEHFGSTLRVRYARLIEQGLRDLRDDHLRAGTMDPS